MNKMFGDLLEKTHATKAQKSVGSRPTVSPKTRLSLESKDRLPSQRSNERSNEESGRQTIERESERTKVRHSFDVFRDQLLDLGDIQQALARVQGTKPRLGDLVQEALDNYIKERRKGRTNEGSADGMNESENDPMKHRTKEGTSVIPLAPLAEGSQSAAEGG